MTVWRVIATALILLLPLVASADVVRVGGDRDYPPFEFINDDSQPEGFNIDLVGAVARAVDFEARFELGPWGEVRAALARGEIDLLPVFVADFRDQEMDFATPHLIVDHEIFVRRNDEEFTGLESLAGREVIVQAGDYVEEQLERLATDIELIPVTTQRDALELLADGRHDAAILTGRVGRRILSEGLEDELTTSGPPLLPVSYALGVRKGNSELLARIEAGLARIKASGEFNELHEKWFDAPAAEEGFGTLTHWLLVAMPMLVASILLVLLWRQSRLHPQEESQAIFAARFRRDVLTGLPNRVELEHAIENALQRARTDHFPRALLHIDLDQFKLINDADDYQTGDEILCRIAEFLRKRSHLGELPARPGSDEFALLLGPSRDPVATAEQLRKELEEMEFELDGKRIQVTASIGLATLDDHTISIGELLKQAEAACYVAKEAGRNRVHAYRTDDEAVAERHAEMRWVREVNLAIKEDRLRLYYQTIEPLKPQPGAELTIEILLRLESPDGEIHSAGEFMPAAEKYFLANRIDRWVLRQTLAWMETHRNRLAHLQRVFINLSTRSLGDDRFLPYALEQLSTHEVSKRQIGFEITESAVMTHLQTGINTIEHLRQLGCQFALDDFGVGISSMAYLKNLPIDVLKIDGSFTPQSESSERSRAVLTEINELGHVLGKTTVIEHIETEAQRVLMAGLGIDFGQGYAISHPRPLNDLLDDPRLSGRDS
jgi:diguanylate cyclase (GGDEF)-like protein